MKVFILTIQDLHCRHALNIVLSEVWLLVDLMQVFSSENRLVWNSASQNGGRTAPMKVVCPQRGGLCETCRLLREHIRRGPMFLGGVGQLTSVAHIHIGPPLA